MITRAPRAPLRLGAVMLTALVATGASVPSPPTQDATTLCHPDTTIGHPAPDLWCIALVPRPDLPNASGLVELRQAETPFDLAVTRDGHHRHHLVATITGLPDPALLNGRAYVAWATTPRFDPMVRLGEVTNGVTDLGEVAFNKFLILVSAESDPATVTRQGRLVLRGTSPSIRMERHLLPGLTEGEGASPDRHGDHAAPPWPMPPMRAGMRPMPGIAGLTPGTTPFLPAASDTTAIPEAKPRQLLTLADGDSLFLLAGLVRRTFQGRTVLMYGYNGQYPGPLLRVPQGATITVQFQNAIGDSSTIHWHGLRLDNRFDGVPGVTQAAVPPGGSFRYRVHFPDAGIYWYHPHVREDIQQDLGLYGNMLVDPASPAWYSPVHREQVLMLDDLLFGEEGPTPWGAATTHALMGRFGNVLLVNGDPDYTLSVERGEVVRFFLTNVSNTRTFNLGFGSARVKVVGADLGRFEREAWAESVVIAPAQRYIVEVQFTEPGRHAITNRVQGIDHVVGAFLGEVDTLGTVDVGTPTAAPDLTADFTRLRHDENLTREVSRYRDRAPLPPDHELLLTLRTRDLPHALTEALQLDMPWFPAVEWSSTMPMMDWLPTTDQVEWILRDRATGRENMEIDWRFRTGSTVTIRLVNDRNTLHAMAHPVHFHGQRVLVLARNGEPVPNLVWKDTLLLPTGSTALVLLELSNPGRWMVHCHIAEHLSAGMMTLMTVDP